MSEPSTDVNLYSKEELVSTLQQKLQEERNWKNGLITVLESMALLGFERCGIFLVNPMKKSLDSHIGKGAFPPKEFVSLSLEDTQYLGVQCVKEKKTIHIRKYQPTDGKQITPSNSVVWVPLVVGDEVFGALTADNAETIEDEQVLQVETIGNLCAAFLERTRLEVTPVVEEGAGTGAHHWLDVGEGYIIIEKKPEKSLELFCDLIANGVPGFAVSRMHPERIRKQYHHHHHHHLMNTPMLWLSRSNVENTIHPEDLPKLVYVIAEFTKSCAQSVVYLDGVEYLTTQTNFENVLAHIQEIKDIITVNKSRLIIPLYKRTLSVKEYSMLEKEFAVLDFKAQRMVASL